MTDPFEQQFEKAWPEIERRMMANALTPEQLEAREAAHRRYEFQRRAELALRDLQRDIGPRYADASFENFERETAEQKAVHSQLADLVTELHQFIRDGRQLFLWGPIGCGKDHLMIAVLKHAARRGYSVSWKQAIDVYDRIAFARDNNDSQPRIYEQLVAPDVLCLSDPVFNRNWSPAKADALAKIVRRRYDRNKPTWVTTNISSLDQAPKLFYPDVFDRLREKTTFVRCNWRSYRGGDQ